MGTLCIFICGNFRPELAAAVRAEGWDDVVVHAFPPHCGRPPLDWQQVAARLPPDCDRVLLLGQACLHHLPPPPAGFPDLRIEVLSQCFHVFAGETLVDEAIAEGAYLLTPIWLANWPARLEALGFTSESAAECFREFAKELLYLDTGIDPAVSARLPELAAALGLPARRLAVGLDYCRAFLARRVQAWRSERQEQEQAQRLIQQAAASADHAAAMDMLQQLARSQNESDVIGDIRHVFQMLFAPRACHYLRLENGQPLGDHGDDVGESSAPELRRQLLALETDYAWLDQHSGFLLRIRHGETVLGLAAVVGLAYPQYHQRYLNLALSITGVCALAIENARNRKRLVEAEKMSSLAIVVAGVAHEVNTPLGVCLTSSSTLHSHTERLAERFAARSMTQSDFLGFLDNAKTCSDLLRRNLERIGRLVDAFREVAVLGREQELRPLRLLPCLEEVVRSFGERLPPGQVNVAILCPSQLRVLSVPGDWATIIRNLISNSLKHGFRNRATGRIQIEVRQDGDNLWLDYRDDGVGLPIEARQHIFDPFFTTDMQHGMGLGMHLVYNLITHRLGGSIQCCAEAAGEGAHFLIRVPWSGPEVQQALEQEKGMRCQEVPS